MESQFINCSSSFPEFKVSFSEVMFEVIPCFVRRIVAFPCLDVVFEDSLFVGDNKGRVYCLTLGNFNLGQSFVFNQVVDGFEDEGDWLGRIVGHLFGDSCLVIKSLRGNAPIIIVQEI